MLQRNPAPTVQPCTTTRGVTGNLPHTALSNMVIGQDAGYQPAPNDLNHLELSELQDGLESSAFTSEHLAKTYLKPIEEADCTVHAAIKVDNSAGETARALDEERQLNCVRVSVRMSLSITKGVDNEYLADTTEDRRAVQSSSKTPLRR